MGCTNSLDGGEPSRPKNRSTMSKIDEPESKLSSLDQARIQIILDYWYDEGANDGSGGNSKNYHQLIYDVREPKVVSPRNEQRRNAVADPVTPEEPAQL